MAEMFWLFATAGGVHKFVQQGRMRALATTSDKRIAAYPGVPTASETVRGYTADVWYGMFAPKGTPPEVIETLNTAVRKAASQAAYLAALERDGMTMSVNTPAEMAQFMRAEVEQWRKVITTAQIKPE